MMATNFLHTTYHLVDMIFVGRLGENAIAAVSVSGSIMMLPFSVLMGLAAASSAMVARYFGGGEIDRASKVAVQALLAGSIIAVGITFFGTVFSQSVIAFFGVESEVLELGTDYIRIIFLGSIFMTLQFLSSGILQAVGDANTAMKITAASSFVNMFLDPLFIFGIWIFPAWGVEGAAVATIISRFVGCAAALLVIIYKRSHLHVRLSYSKLERSFISKIIRIGTPSSLQMFSRSVASIVMMRIVASFGTLFLATYGVGVRIEMFVLMPGFGLATAAATLVGQNLGAKKPERAERCTITAAFYHFIIMTTWGIVLYIFAEPIFKIFNDNPEVLRLGENYIRIIVFSYPFIAVAIVINRSLIGAGNTLTPMILTLITLFGITVPLALFLPHFPWLGANGLWVAIVFGNMALSVILTFVFKKGAWKIIVL